MADVVYDPKPHSIEHSGLRTLYDYWEGLREGRGLPGRQNIDPLDIPALLPNIMLIDVAGEGSMRLRLVGTALVNRIGRDITGLPIEDAYPDKDWEKILDDYHYAISARRPCWRRHAIPDGRGRRMTYQRLLLPLARDGETVDMLLAAIFWGDPV